MVCHLLEVKAEPSDTGGSDHQDQPCPTRTAHPARCASDGANAVDQLLMHRVLAPVVVQTTVNFSRFTVVVSPTW